jgi:hypothetical protein
MATTPSSSSSPFLSEKEGGWRNEKLAEAALAVAFRRLLCPRRSHHQTPKLHLAASLHPTMLCPSPSHRARLHPHATTQPQPCSAEPTSPDAFPTGSPAQLAAALRAPTRRVLQPEATAPPASPGSPPAARAPTTRAQLPARLCH